MKSIVVLALAFLGKSDGSSVLLENNDIPGFTGFPVTVRESVAACLRAKVSRHPE
jgi:hypothetical protein